MQQIISQLTSRALLILVLLLPATLGAQNPPPVSAALQLLNDSPHAFTSTRLDSDTYTGRIILTIAPSDVGKAASIYVVGQYQDRWFQKTADQWLPWDTGLKSLVPSAHLVLKPQNELEIFNRQELLPGNYRIFAAYRLTDGSLVESESGIEFVVQSASEESLHRFESDAAMVNYLKQGMTYSASDQNSSKRLALTTAAADSGNSGAVAPLVSTTNVQEAGVDEADTSKTDGEHLYTLRDCGSDTCVVTFKLDAAQASAGEVGVYHPQSSANSDAAGAAANMYLIQNGPQGKDTLVTLSGENHYLRWFDVWSWGGNQTALEFLDASDPARLQLRKRLVLDGSLISSRRVNDALYIVTRFTPEIDGYVTYAEDEATKQANAALLTKASLSDLLPKARLSDQGALELVESENCYLATSAVDTSRNPTMITITTVPLSDPAAFTSTCYLGDSETLYMTPHSLYLATTRSEYQILSSTALVYDPQHETAIHKFALESNGVAYLGSGKVSGHLGWSEDKRSFRMGEGGEQGEYLNIVTSVGDSWGPSSSTRLSVLKAGAGKMQTIKTLDGIGKPDEQLYAARFVGDRAYLVTFRVIDPLYVVDLSDQENPQIAGELEIEGYSDYLHPISDTLLLGIGKDAIPDADATDFDFSRGAWFQGVKLSLFDVANPAAPREINSLVFGKRGSDSEILHDHHAIAFLPASTGRPARLAIPIEIHATDPAHADFDPTSPNQWYEFTRRGLFEFEVSNNGLKEVGYIEADSTTNRIALPMGSRFGDRAVLLENSVFYVHQSEVLSGFWGQKQ